MTRSAGMPGGGLCDDSNHLMSRMRPQREGRAVVVTSTCAPTRTLTTRSASLELLWFIMLKHKENFKKRLKKTL